MTRLLLFMAALGAGAWLLQAAEPAAGGHALVLTVDDAIGPATADFIHKGLAQAAASGARLVVLRLDTPGGLDSAMRDIIRDMLASPMPVAVYVAPSGARAASAGTYMMYAAHLAVMAPGTNLGAATPVQIGGLPGIEPGPTPARPDDQDTADRARPDGESDAAEPAEDGEQAETADDAGATDAAADGGDAMTRKMVNDAVAYIRSLAELRGRNAGWAEQAVRSAASLSAERAHEQGVIDFIATDVTELLHKADGRAVLVNGQQVALSTQGVEVQTIEPDWRNRLLAVITNPNVAYILMLLGIYGLFFELANPGFVLPGVIGAISLLLALYALQVLPVNYAGLGLILVGIMFMIAELFVPSFGALGIGGIIAFAIGSIILFDQDGGAIAVSLPLVVAVSALSAAFFLIAVRSLVGAYRRPVVTGAEELIGSTGIVLEDFHGKGRVHLHGETWQVQADRPFRQGDRVRVIGRDGLVLQVTTEQEQGT